LIISIQNKGSLLSFQNIKCREHQGKAQFFIKETYFIGGGIIE